MTLGMGAPTVIGFTIEFVRMNAVFDADPHPLHPSAGLKLIFNGEI